MFTDDELDGCPSYWVEDWLNKHEAEIRYASQYDADHLRNLLILLFQIVRDKP